MRVIWGAACVAVVLSGGAFAQAMDWDKLPEPVHLTRVLDTDRFLGGSGGGSSAGRQTGLREHARFVQVGAFRTRGQAEALAEGIAEAGLIARLATQRSWVLVLMPETERNSAETLAAWARRSGYRDAFVREIKQ